MESARKQIVSAQRGYSNINNSGIRNGGGWPALCQHTMEACVLFAALVRVRLE
jgi:hypothetical protein